jgi:protein SCO1/2
MSTSYLRAHSGLLGLAVALLLPAAAGAQRLEGQPEPLEGVGITEHLDEPVPLDLTFRDEQGREVALGRYFSEGKPVALNLVYFDCPMLCNVFLDGFTATLRELDWTPGKEFEIVTVSIDPEDTPEGATAKRAHYIDQLGRPEAADGWHFLTGNEENVRALARAVGFGYRLNEDTGEYAHSAALFLATPDGRLSRYLYGVAFDPQTLRLSLVEASDGKVGTAVDQLILFCFAYDHTAGRYGPAAMNLMRAAGAVIVVAMGLYLASAWRRSARRRHSETLGAQS